MTLGETIDFLKEDAVMGTGFDTTWMLNLMWMSHAIHYGGDEDRELTWLDTTIMGLRLIGMGRLGERA